MTDTKRKRLADMTEAELIAAAGDVDKYDDPAVAEAEFREPTPSEQAYWNKVRGRGRPRVGAGSLKVTITVERARLQRFDLLAKLKNMTRSGLLGKMIEEQLAGAKTAGKPEAAPEPESRTRKQGSWSDRLQKVRKARAKRRHTRHREESTIR